MSTIVTDFATLFRGRPDALGRVWGESVKTALDDGDYSDHLFVEGASLGVYPLMDRGQLTLLEDQTITAREDALGHSLGSFWVQWGCTDIDLGYEASKPLADRLQAALAALGLTGWIEKTKGKGYHVWVFAVEPIPAEVMRRALLAAHQAADVPVDEVNPKQTDVGHLKVGLGNYVNLPYPAGWGDIIRRCVTAPDGGWLDMTTFVPAALASRATFEQLVEVARLYQAPPPKEHVPVDTAYDGSLNPIVHRLSALGQLIFREGPLEGQDRSSKLAQLAHIAYEVGLSATEAFALLEDADRRWGKFADRVDRDDQLQGLVTNAYG